MNDEFKSLQIAFPKEYQEIIDNDLEEKFQANIFVRRKDDMYLYNYNHNVLVERDNPLLIKCRGLVLREDGKILNYPFDRFFNEFESECATIDWKTVEIQEKIDGSLICVFWNDNDWEITTRGSFYPNELADVNFAEEFKRVYSKPFRLNNENSYTFELVTKKNRIVTWYDEEFITLLGGRNLNTLKEIYVGEAERIFLKTKNIKIYKASNVAECKSLFSKLRDDEEGLVIVDANFNRMKLKQESYIKLSKIKQLKEQDIFDYILGKSEIDQEYLEKCDDVKSKIIEMKEIWDNVHNKIKNMFFELRDDYIKDGDRKAFAMRAIQYSYKSILFLMLDGKDITQNLKWDKIKEWHEQTDNY